MKRLIKCIADKLFKRSKYKIVTHDNDTQYYVVIVLFHNGTHNNTLFKDRKHAIKYSESMKKCINVRMTYLKKSN